MRKLLCILLLSACPAIAGLCADAITGLPVPCVGGAGNLTTVGAVPYVSASGILNQAAGQFFWDATNNRLGIGTATPSSSLTVGANNFTVDTLGRTAIAGYSTSAQLTIGGDPTALLGDVTVMRQGRDTDTGSNYIQSFGNNTANGRKLYLGGYSASFNPANGVVLTVDPANSRVGIGTITPATTLQVVGGKILLDNAQSIQFKDSAGTARTILQVDAGDNVYLDSTATGGDMFFRALGVEKMTIKGTSGNVGIGTTGPTYKLDVAKSGASGTARFYDQTATTGATRVLITLGAADTTSTQVFEIGGLMKFSGSNSTGAGTALLGTNSPAVTNTAPYTWLKVLTSDGSTAYVPAWK